MSGPAGNVRYRVRSGKHLLAASISPFDPLRTLALKTYFILTVPDAFQVSSFESYIAAFNR
jgi:hypothetical protein